MGFPKSGTRTTRARVVLNSQNPRIADLSGGPGCAVACLELFAQALEEDVADGGRNDGDGKVLDREDVNQGDGEPLTWAIGAVELAHQEVGVEEEDDESDLDQRAQDVAEGARGQWAWGHGMMILGISFFSPDSLGLYRSSAVWEDQRRKSGQKTERFRAALDSTA
jgi:hypothetical protein